MSKPTAEHNRCSLCGCPQGYNHECHACSAYALHTERRPMTDPRLEPIEPGKLSGIRKWVASRRKRGEP